MLAVLSADGASCAPHVLARLTEELGGDALAVRETASRLDQEARQGLRPLPSPLPLAPSTRARYSALVLHPRDRELLLAVVLTVQSV